MDKKSYIQVYTGNGKGKTTASIGLAVRAAMAGKKIFIGQFVKGMDYGELRITEFIPSIEIIQFGRDCFIFNDPTPEDVKKAENGLEQCIKALNGDYDMVILEELNIALYYKLLDINKVLDAINCRNPETEVVITGRYAPQEIIDMADLVTEMKEIKHYYKKGVKARKGIEF